MFFVLSLSNAATELKGIYDDCLPEVNYYRLKAVVVDSLIRKILY